MSALRGVDSDATGSVAKRSVTPRVQDGAYLTNEVFLYRVAAVGVGEVGEMVELEDCYGLDVVCVPVSDLHARRLRVVVPASSGVS